MSRAAFGGFRSWVTLGPKKSSTRIRGLCKVSEDQLTVGEGTPLSHFRDGKGSFAMGIFELAPHLY